MQLHVGPMYCVAMLVAMLVTILLLFNFFSSILHMVWFYYCIRVDTMLHNTALLCYDKSSMIII